MLRILLAGVILCMPCTCAAAEGPSPSPETPPLNVVLLVIDTLRADRVTAERNGVPVMPQLHAIARKGWWFRAAYAQSSWTKPSMASLLTGLYPKTHRVLHGTQMSMLEGKDPEPVEGLSSEKESVAAYLKRHGYMTFAVQTNRVLAAKDGFAQGFDEYHESAMTGAQPVNGVVYKNAGKFKRPFFLYIHYMDPHAPYNPPAPHRDAFGPTAALPAPDLALLESAPSFKSYYVDKLMSDLGRKGARSFEMLSEPGREHVRALYDGDCNYVDAHLRRMLDEVLRHWPNTIFIITADHGEELWDHGGMGHGNRLYQELIHVPLVIIAPGRDARVVDVPVESIDILPTLASLLGLAPSPHWQGRDLSQAELPARPVYSETFGMLSSGGVQLEAVISDGRKLVRGQGAGVGAYVLGDGQREALDSTGETAALGALLDAHAAACQAHPMAAIPPLQGTLDAETIEGLKALGYLFEKPE